MEFDESRLYQAGDDIRNIDWRVTARTGKPHTKLFREERERPVFVWVDYRAPMFFATRGVYKSVFAARAAALIAWNAIQQGDRVGGLVFSETEHHELKPGLGKAAVLHLINRLVHHPAWDDRTTQTGSEQADLKKALQRLNRLVRPGSLVYLISDFRGAVQAKSEFARLARHCEVILINIHDVLEETLPAKGIFRLRRQEHELVINTYDEAIVERYQQQSEQHTQWLEDLAGRYRLRYIPCLTTDEPLKKLMAHAR